MSYLMSLTSNKDGDASRSVNCFDDDVFSDEELVSQPPDELGQQNDESGIPEDRDVHQSGMELMSL